MRNELSPHKAQLLDYIKEHPGQTSSDYQALMDALADQMGHKGRLIKVDSALTALHQKGYVVRTGKGVQADAFKYTAIGRSPAPIPAKAVPPRRVDGYTFKVVYKIDFPTGNGITLSHDDAKAVYKHLKGVFE